MNTDNKALTTESLINEINIMKTCVHDNIVEYIDGYNVKGKQIWVSHYLPYFLASLSFSSYTKGNNLPSSYIILSYLIISLP